MTHCLETHDVERPNTLSRVVGNRNMVQRLARLLSTSRPRSLLFSGPTGCGKTTLAEIILEILGCHNLDSVGMRPCGECLGCVAWFGKTLHCSTSLRNVGTISTEPEIFGYGNSVVFVDELQDVADGLQRQLRKFVESCKQPIIFATSDPESLDDALLNRLQPYHFALKHPTRTEIKKHLIAEFTKRRLSYTSPDLLLRVADEYRCELRACCEFPRKVSRETDGQLTEDYLDELFPPDF